MYHSSSIVRSLVRLLIFLLNCIVNWVKICVVFVFSKLGMFILVFCHFSSKFQMLNLCMHYNLLQQQNQPHCLFYQEFYFTPSSNNSSSQLQWILMMATFKIHILEAKLNNRSSPSFLPSTMAVQDKLLGEENYITWSKLMTLQHVSRWKLTFIDEKITKQIRSLDHQQIYKLTNCNQD